MLVAGIEEMTRLRIVRGAHDVAFELFPQNIGVLALDTSGHCLAGEWKGLVPVETAEFNGFPIQFKSIVGEARLAKANAAAILLEDALSVQESHSNGVQIWF